MLLFERLVRTISGLTSHIVRSIKSIDFKHPKVLYTKLLRYLDKLLLLRFCEAVRNLQNVANYTCIRVYEQSDYTVFMPRMQIL